MLEKDHAPIYLNFILVQTLIFLCVVVFQIKYASMFHFNSVSQGRSDLFLKMLKC